MDEGWLSVGGGHFNDVSLGRTLSFNAGNYLADSYLLWNVISQFKFCVVKACFRIGLFSTFTAKCQGIIGCTDLWFLWKVWLAIL